MGKWIKESEKPARADGISVLVGNPKGFVGQCYKLGDKWYFNCGPPCRQSVPWKVEYWMALPKPPKGTI